MFYFLPACTAATKRDLKTKLSAEILAGSPAISFQFRRNEENENPLGASGADPGFQSEGETQK